MSFVLLPSLSAPPSLPGERLLSPSRMGEPTGHLPLLLWGLATCPLIRDRQEWLVAPNPLPVSCSLDEAPWLGLNTLVVCVLGGGYYKVMGKCVLGGMWGPEKGKEKHCFSQTHCSAPCGNSEEDRSGVSKGFLEL